MKSCQKMIAMLLAICMMLSSLAVMAVATDDAADENTLTLAYDELVNQGLDPDALNNRLMGDYNNDRVIGADDARIALRKSVSLEKHLSKEQLFVLDVDQDGQVTAADARSILRMTVGLETINTIEIDGFEDLTIELTFNYGAVQDDSLPKSQEVKKGTIPEEPELPELDDYVFLGWYSDKDLTKGFYFADELNESTEIFAKWTNRLKDEELQLDEELVTSILKKHHADSKEGQESISFGKGAIQEAKVDYILKTGAADVYIGEANGLINHTFGMIGSAIDVTLVGEDELETAEIVFTYNENELPENVSEEDLGIVWYDEENNKMVLLEDARIDKENNTISYTTSHFSKYVVVNTKAWVENWAHKQLVNRIDGTSLRFNIVLCLDDSGSMSGQRATVCAEAAKGFVDQLVDGDNIGIIKFNSYPTTLVVPTAISAWQKDTIKSEIKLYASGGTNFTNAAVSAIEMLNSMPQKTENNEILKNYIVFLSDGQSSISDSALEDLVKYGYSVLAIGVGNSVSESELRKMADRSGGSYASVADPNDITAVFQTLQGENIGLSVDSDGDGIADLVETDGMIATDGYIYRTDPKNPDTDGDGFKDGYEMGRYNTDNGLFEIISSPTTPTYQSDRAKFGNAKISIKPALGDAKRTTIDQYKKISCSVSVEILKYDIPTIVVDGKEYHDYLSDVVYANAKNFQIEIFVDGKSVKTSKEISLEGSSGYRTLSCSEEFNIGNHTFTAKIIADNADEVVVSQDFNSYDAWLTDVQDTLYSSGSKICESTTKVVREYGQLTDERKKNEKESIKNAIFLESWDLPDITITNPSNITTDKTLKDEIQYRVAELFIGYAEERINKTFASKDPEKLVKNIMKDIVKSDVEFTITVNGQSYTVTVTDQLYGGWATVYAVNQKTNKKYSYQAIARQELLESAISDLLTDSNELYNDLMEDYKNALISDTASMLGIDQLSSLLKGKALKALDKVIEKSGKFSFNASDLKNAYDYYKKAEKAISKAKSANKEPTAKSIESAMTAINSLLTSCASL